MCLEQGMYTLIGVDPAPKIGRDSRHEEVKTMKTRNLTLLALIAVFIAGVAFAVSQTSDDQPKLLSQLRSDDWLQRSRGVEKLIADRKALGSKEVKDALVDLLDRENQLVESTLRASNGLEGVSVKYGEGYSEYYSVLLDAVDQVADYNDKRTLNILVHCSYNSDSPFAVKLASHGEVVVPFLLEMANSDISSSRASALGVLGEVLKIGKYGVVVLTPVTQGQVEQALIGGAADEDIGVRLLAVRSLGVAGNKEAVALLERIAESDPATIPAGAAKNRYPVREEALKALSLIKAEEKGKPM
jgi:HEAT repeat protein